MHWKSWLSAAIGDIAQLVEHFNGIEGVSGSNPLISIKLEI